MKISFESPDECGDMAQLVKQLSWHRSTLTERAIAAFEKLSKAILAERVRAGRLGPHLFQDVNAVNMFDVSISLSVPQWIMLLDMVQVDISNTRQRIEADGSLNDLQRRLGLGQVMLWQSAHDDARKQLERGGK